MQRKHYPRYTNLEVDELKRMNPIERLKYVHKKPLILSEEDSEDPSKLEQAKMEAKRFGVGLLVELKRDLHTAYQGIKVT